jgi:hypothetical protein
MDCIGHGASQHLQRIHAAWRPTCRLRYPRGWSRQAASAGRNGSSRSPGVIAPPASAEMTAFIAVAILWPDIMAFSPRAVSRGSALDPRQGELHRRFAARRQDAFDTEPWLRDGATAREPEWGSVGGLAGPPGRIAGLTLGEPPRRSRVLFPLFYLVEIRHCQLLQSQILHPPAALLAVLLFCSEISVIAPLVRAPCLASAPPGANMRY